MFEMNDEIAFIEFAEVDLGAITGELLGALQAPPSVRRISAKQFRGGKNYQLAIRKNETARERALEKLDVFQFGVPHDFAETLDFAFGLEIDDDAKSARAPIPEPRGELRAFCLHQHEVADGEIADVAVVECAAEILRLIAAQPAFADQNIGIVIFLRLDREPQMIGRDVIADSAFLLFRGGEQDLDALQIPHGRLRVDVELAQRFDVVTEKLRAHGARSLPGI